MFSFFFLVNNHGRIDKEGMLAINSETGKQKNIRLAGTIFQLERDSKKRVSTAVALPVG